MFNEKHTTNILPPFLYLYEDAIHEIKSLNQRHSFIHPSISRTSVCTYSLRSVRLEISFWRCNKACHRITERTQQNLGDDHTTASERIQTKQRQKLYTTVTSTVRRIRHAGKRRNAFGRYGKKMEISLHHFVTEQELTRNSNNILWTTSFTRQH